MAFENRKYAIFATTELNKIDFNEVLETSISTVRKSVDETKTFTKWDGNTIPSSVAGLSTYQGPYTHSEIMVILNTEERVGTGST